MTEKTPILYLIRHGEKPPKKPDGEDADGLSVQGITRSQGLVEVFGRQSQYNIGYIIAQKPHKHGKQDRPYLTVKPLADSLGVPFNFTIDRDDVDQVNDAVNDFKNGQGAYQGDGNVLVCWEHQALEKVAVALGVQEEPNYPGTRFDIIWTIEAPYDKINSTTSEDVPGLDTQPGTIAPPSK